MYLFVSCCLFHDCLAGCLSVLTVVSVCDRVEIWSKRSMTLAAVFSRIVPTVIYRTLYTVQ